MSSKIIAMQNAIDNTFYSQERSIRIGDIDFYPLDKATFADNCQNVDYNSATSVNNLGICYFYGRGVPQDYRKALGYFITAADMGDKVAQYNAGYCYEENFGIEPHTNRAVEYYTRAAERGDAFAQYALARFCNFGIWVKEDIAQRDEWYRRAFENFEHLAEHGDMYAQFMLAVCYYGGQGVEADSVTAVRIYTELAECGYVKALLRLSDLYGCSRYVENDNTKKRALRKQAIACYQRAAEQGDAYSQYMVGHCDVYNGSASKSKRDNAIEWFAKAAEQGYPLAMREMGACYKYGGKNYAKDFDKAAEWYLKAFDRGDVYAIISMGHCFYKQGEHQDYSKAVECFTKAVEYCGAEQAREMIELGRCYKFGYGVPQNYEKAFEYYKKSAELGYRGAAYYLGCFYAIGDGVEQDYKEAAKWFARAAEMGDGYAKFCLAVCYAEGKGVERDYVKAVCWYNGARPSVCAFEECGIYNNLFGKGKVSWKSAVPDQWNERAAQEIVEQFELAGRYCSGDGVEQDYARAAQIYQKLTHYGSDKKSYFCLALCYAYGKGVEQSYSTAAQWYIDAEEAVDLAQQKELYAVFCGDEDAEWDAQIVIDWYQKAASEGLYLAQDRLAECYFTGNGVEQDYAKAGELFLKAAERCSVNCRSLGRLADCYYYGRGIEQDFVEAAKWYKKASDYGDVYAKYMLAGCYAKGEGVAQDWGTAFWLYDALVRKNDDTEAKFCLAVCYADGKGVEQNYRTAVDYYIAVENAGMDILEQAKVYKENFGEDGSKWDFGRLLGWYKNAADQNDAEAQCRLADCYNVGDGVEQDYRIAAEWYRKAAEHDNSHAQCMLADYYAKGKGVEQDYIEAVRWYTKSAGYGNQTAIADLSRLKANLKQRGICSNCGGKLNFLTKKCKACGKRAE